MTLPANIIPTDEQLSAITMMKENMIGILFGAPGVGKSMAIKFIINWAESNNLSIVQGAPTGRASRRMVEATGRNASTIHTMLGCQYDTEVNQFVFSYNKENPIPYDLVILDEVSMITNNLMARVMEAINPNRTRLLLVGDSNQLPSVGTGAILRDLISSNIVPKVELTVIHRNSGGIVKACHKIKNGNIYYPKRKIDLEKESPDNLIHLEISDPEKILKAIEKIVCERMPLRGFDPIEDVQVISPVNEKGPLSCKKINQVLQNALNPDPAEQERKVQDELLKDDLSWIDPPKEDLFEKSDRLEKEAVSGNEPVSSDSENVKGSSAKLNRKPKKEKINFRVGDKVINTKNDKAIKTDNRPSAIVNGDIGIVKEISKKRMVVLFSDPDREIILPRFPKNLLHAYCITCHKFQGSEAPVIIIPVHRQFNYFLTNSWIYTAISRGKIIVITIGQFNTIEKAIRNRVPNERFTMLKERILAEDKQLMDIAMEGI